VNGPVLWLLVAAGLLVVIARRRSVAVGLVTGQAIVLAGVAFRDASSGGDVVAAAALAVRGIALALLFFFLVARTRESQRIQASVSPLVRATAAISVGLVLIWLVPAIGLSSRNAERAVLTLVAFGLVVIATRRATLFQILGIILVENALALAALELPGNTSPAIELGVAFDLTLIALVAAVFHERIFAEFGAGDTRNLRSLRD
jgi:hydrogenase-4 membrane subunit HyfE